MEVCSLCKYSLSFTLMICTLILYMCMKVFICKNIWIDWSEGKANVKTSKIYFQMQIMRVQDINFLISFCASICGYVDMFGHVCLCAVNVDPRSQLLVAFFRVLSTLFSNTWSLTGLELAHFPRLASQCAPGFYQQWDQHKNSWFFFFLSLVLIMVSGICAWEAST